MSDSILIFPESEDDQAGDHGGPSAEAQQAQRLGLLEAIIFAAEAPPTLERLAAALDLPEETVSADLELLQSSCQAKSRGIEVRRLAGSYRLLTKQEHRDAVSAFLRSERPRVKLSQASLETLAIVAYRQPVTVPEIASIRSVASAGGPIHTLLRHKLVATAGRKKVIGRPMQYKTTEEFLVRFGLDSLAELPTAKELASLGAEAEADA